MLAVLLQAVDQSLTWPDVAAIIGPMAIMCAFIYLLTRGR